MDGLTCDGCGKGLLIDAEVRYQVKIEVQAAYDPLEITSADLKKDLEGEITDLIEKMYRMDPKKLEGQVYRRFEFDLCPACQEKFLQDPLGGGRFQGPPPASGEVKP